MEQSPSWEANRSSASQEIPRILWNPEGSLPHSQSPATCPYPELDQSSPCTPSRFLRVHFNIILPSTLCLLSGLFPTGLSHQSPICTCPVLHPCHMPHPSYSFWFYHANNVWRAVQTTEPLVMYFSALLCYLVRLRLKFLLCTNFWNILSLRCPLSARDQVSYCRILLRNGGAIRIRLKSNVLPYFSDGLY